MFLRLERDTSDEWLRNPFFNHECPFAVKYRWVQKGVEVVVYYMQRLNTLPAAVGSKHSHYACSTAERSIHSIFCFAGDDYTADGKTSHLLSSARMKNYRRVV